MFTARYGVAMGSRLSIPLRAARRTESRRLISDQHSPAAVAKEVYPSESTRAASVPRAAQRPPPRRNERSAGFYLMLMGLATITVPPISYVYWEHRKAHMKAKKEEILREIQARVRPAS